MAQESTGEFSNNIDVDRYIRDIYADDTTQMAELEKLPGVVWLTDHLKSPNCPVTCLSYPYNASNQTGIELFKVSQFDEMLPDSDIEDAITDVILDEQWLYSAIVDLFHISENPGDPYFSKSNEIKQQIISYWMEQRNLSFTSDWVIFLKNILPGGDVSDDEIRSAKRKDGDTLKELAIAIQKITDKLIPEYHQGPVIKGQDVCEIARLYVETTLESICEPLKDGSISREEFDNRASEIEAMFGLSSRTHLECLKICAAMSDCDISNFV